MHINDIVTLVSEIVKDEVTRKEIYTRILEQSDEYDLEGVELGIDDIFDVIYEDYVEEDEEEFEEDKDYEDDGEDSSSEWDEYVEEEARQE